MADSAKIVEIDIYKGEDSDWYAGLFSSNGNEIFRTSEGYKNKTDLLDVCETNHPTAKINIYLSQKARKDATS